MRVLHVYSGNLFGGIETMLITLARCRNLCPEMEPHFAVCFEGRLSEELRTTGAPVHMLGAVRTSRPLSVLRARQALAQVLREENPDVVICHGAWSLSIFGPIARKAALPVVFWLHGPTNGKHWLERWARRTPPELAICNSDYTASTVKNLFVNVRTEVNYCPVMIKKRVTHGKDRLAIRDELNTSKDSVVIIQVSRMEPLKGHRLHLRALEALRDSADWVCWFVGGGQRPHELEYLDELRATAESAGVADRVRFVGERSDVHHVLAAADIFCQPNIGPEGFGLTFIEALGSGLPVVTTALGGAKEIVNESCGFLIPSNDAPALTDVLRGLINNRTLRSELGAAGAQRARELCDPASQIQRLHRTLATLA
jgi:glycosyltransferase involved in cell wall biosynthesis